MFPNLGRMLRLQNPNHSPQDYAAIAST